MSKRPWTLIKVAKTIAAGAALTALVALDAITAVSASAQSRAGQTSQTMQRLQQLQQEERDRQSTEDAKWRRFPGHDDPGATPASRWVMNVLMGTPPKTPPKCEFYWPGWKLNSNGTRITKVRSCGRNWVAVDCKSLRVSWKHYPAIYARWSDWRLPTSNELDTAQMVAALCDNIASPLGEEAQSSAPSNSLQLRPSITPISEAKPSLQLPSSGQFGSINVGAEGKQILQLLGEMGVETVIKDECPKPGTLGAYSRFDNLLVLCKASLKYPALATEVIAHEAVHALQDCIQPGGIKGSASRSLMSFFRVFNEGKHAARFEDLLRDGLANRPNIAAYLRDLKTSMPPKMFLMEREAYALEIYPKSVALLLKNIGIPLCRPLE